VPSWLVRYFRIAGCLTAILPVELNLTMNFPKWIHCIYARFISELFRPHFVRQIFCQRFCQPPTGLVTQIARQVGWWDISVSPVVSRLFCHWNWIWLCTSLNEFIVYMPGSFLNYFDHIFVRQIFSHRFCQSPTGLVSQIARQVG